jgi:cAMP phosphodiesterase
MTNFAAYMINSRQVLFTLKSRVGLWFVVAGLIFSACQKEKRPEGVLSPEELSKLMVELYLAEARIGGQNMARDTAMKYFIPFEEKLKGRYGVSDSIIRITYQYYISHPEELEKIYDSVIDTLSLREQKERTRPYVN